MKQYDLIILGGGAAGFAAAMKANELKAQTLLVNNRTIGIGGTCVNVGCVPTKFMLNIGDLIDYIAKPKFNGLTCSFSSDFAQLIEEKNKLVSQLRVKKYENVLKALSNVQYREGEAKFISKSEILIDDQKKFTADKFIIATGSSTFIAPIEGIENVKYLTNIDALQLKKLPRSMIVVGGGPLGLEFSQMFARFGTKVILLHRSNTIAPREEPELSFFLKQSLQDDSHIEIHTNVEILLVKEESEKILVKALINEEEKLFKSEKLLIATGRRANIKNLNLESLNLKLGTKGEIIVNSYMKANDHIWAAGDVTGEPMLETVAARKGMIAANNALSERKIEMNYNVIPLAIFTNPQIGSVGLTDEQANNEGYVCNCRTIPFELVPKARIIKEGKGAIKVVINNETEEILGIHILSHDAADLIHEGVMILRNKMKLDEVINTIHVFPTLSEGIKLACQSFKRDITKMSCCIE